MKICTCTKCRYIFLYPLLPTTCPDCGSHTVRSATEQERKDYHRNQKILAQEIRMGLYAATG